jgi:aromatic ring-opening dioxygenase catalytic subunit (LigB family)
MNKTRNPIPAIVVSHPPAGTADTARFAHDVRTYAETMNAAGVVVVAPHFNRPGDPVTVKIEAARSAVSLVSRIVHLLKSAGLMPDADSGWPREAPAWNAVATEFTDSGIPAIHVSVPSRFGPALMTLTAAALESLRHEGILLVGLSDDFGDAMLFIEAENESGPWQQVSV